MQVYLSREKQSWIRSRFKYKMSLFESTKNTRTIIDNSFRYIRSDVPVYLSGKERQWLIDNNVRIAVDLREKSEQKQKQCILENDSNFQYFLLPVTGGNIIPKSVDEVALSYINMVDDAMNSIIDTIMSAGSNVMYFCNAGKDRTGVVSAIILNKLGYSKQYIIDDYLLSGANLKDELKLFVEENPEVDINVITPKAEYMVRFLEYINDKL